MNTLDRLEHYFGRTCNDVIKIRIGSLACLSHIYRSASSSSQIIAFISTNWLLGDQFRYRMGTTFWLSICYPINSSTFQYAI